MHKVPAVRCRGRLNTDFMRTLSLGENFAVKLFISLYFIFSGRCFEKEFLGLAWSVCAQSQQAVHCYAHASLCRKNKERLNNEK